MIVPTETGIAICSDNFYSVFYLLFLFLYRNCIQYYFPIKSRYSQTCFFYQKVKYLTTHPFKKIVKFSNNYLIFQHTIKSTMKKISISPKFLAIIVITSFFVTGSFESVLNSIILNTEYNFNGTLKLAFSKMYFQTWGLFFGLSLCSIPLFIQNYLQKKKNNSGDDKIHPSDQKFVNSNFTNNEINKNGVKTNANGANSQRSEISSFSVNDENSDYDIHKKWMSNNNDNKNSTKKTNKSAFKNLARHEYHNYQEKPKLILFKESALPSICFILSATIQNYSLTVLAPSVYQIFSGFQLLFTSLFSVSFRHHRLFLSDWTGLFVNVFGMIFSGITLLLRGRKTNDEELPKIFTAFVTLIVAQGIRAFQCILEERLLHDTNMTPLMLASFEGIWGLYLITLIIMPLANILNPTSPFYENSIESFKMIFNSRDLGLTELFYIIVITLFTFCGIFVLYQSSALNKNLYDTIRPFFVWVVSVGFKYLFNMEGSLVYIDGFTVLEFIGCLFAAIGALIFNKIIKFPCFVYDDSDLEKLVHENENEESSKSAETDKLSAVLYTSFI
ncbi:hypothetical protein TRFO_03709 [Tritrichomonas foetus]|uniref:EamA domain-containing protein n=1 Tax=Tritrichomonas foetus TaxID=1144522 RepID=A0A1J4KLB7_9EUKA|nr:hypothetical protein TRFO_03709 [Tritrichomonas foetus]|eukprot:OHT12089.1 hypothetical protein TRFO_03709 [Tritrichomonas foetus]